MKSQSRLPGLAGIVRAMRQLANTELERSPFFQACRDFGWQCQSATDEEEEENYVAFHLPRVERWLHITLGQGLVNCAVLPLLYWENFDEEFAGSPQIYQRERAKFDRDYAMALQKTAEILGAPLRSWTETSEDRFQKALWQGQRSLLVLQQDDYDIQYGFDINFLIQPHQGRLPKTLELVV